MVQRQSNQTPSGRRVTLVAVAKADGTLWRNPNAKSFQKRNIWK